MARPEPGVSWESYRCKERGLLVWLVKSQEFRNDPVSILKAALSFYKEKEMKKLESNRETTRENSSATLVSLGADAGSVGTSSGGEINGNLGSFGHEGIDKHENQENCQNQDNCEKNEEVLAANSENKDFELVKLHNNNNTVEETDEVKVAALVAQQLDVVRSNLQKCYQELQDVETLVGEIWALNINAPSLSKSSLSNVSSSETSSHTISSASEKEEFINKNSSTSDWFVVDNDKTDLETEKKSTGLLSTVRRHATKLGGL